MRKLKTAKAGQVLLVEYVEMEENKKRKYLLQFSGTLLDSLYMAQISQSVQDLKSMSYIRNFPCNQNGFYVEVSLLPQVTKASESPNL